MKNVKDMKDMKDITRIPYRIAVSAGVLTWRSDRMHHIMRHQEA